MTPKNKLFIGILVLSLIVNLLIIFNLNYFYIRAILAFVFIITIPGLLIMLCLKIRNINFWEYLVYTIGLSVAFIMFAGLAVNWILPFLQITDKPLSLWPILICFDTILLILWIIAQRRNEDNVHLLIFQLDEFKRKRGRKANFIPKFQKFTWLDRIFIIIPMFFPFMAVIGAFLLNNHGTNIVTMIMLGAIAVYVFCVVLFREKLNENVYPWALWMIGLALLLSGWMRTWYLAGIDNSLEYYLFKLTSLRGFWLINSYWNAYNAMLSLNILPTIINLFSLNDINNYFIFKLLFQIIVSFLPIVLFLFFSKIFNKTISFLSVIFFVSLPMLYSGTSLGIRQEIAFLFFGLMLLILFSKEINSKVKNLLFVIFGFSMIVSHYSTSYIALAIFLFTYVSTLVYKILENRKIKKGKLKSEKKQDFPLSGILIMLLLVFGFLWYLQITPTGEGATSFLKNAIQNMNDIFKEDLQAGNQGIIGNFLTLNNERKDSQAVLDEYVNVSVGSSSSENFIKPHIVSPYGGGVYINKINLFIINLKYYTEFFGRILVILGAVILLFYKGLDKIIIDKSYLSFYKTMVVLTLVLGFMFVIMPLFSISYDLSRFYNQIILICAPLSILGLLVIPKITKNNKIFYLLVSIFIIFYFLNISGFFLIFNNNPEVSLRLANYGREYNFYDILKVEKDSFSWAINEKSINEVKSDSKLQLRYHLFVEPDETLKIRASILTLSLDKKSIFLLGYANKFKDFATITYKSYWVPINLQTEFLNDNKNKIYNNGGSEIFK